MAKKKEGGGPSPSSSGKKPSDAAYKAEMRWISNKKKRAIRHEKRMETQAARCLERYALGKPLHSKLKRKLDFNALSATAP